MEFVEQAGVDEAGEQSRAADDVDVLARLLPEFTDLVDVADDPRRRPRRFGERAGEHEVRRRPGDMGVRDFARVRVPAEHGGGGVGVVEDGLPELLVLGEHAAAEDEGVDRPDQLDAVGPRVDPVDLARGVEDVAVQGHLHH